MNIGGAFTWVFSFMKWAGEIHHRWHETARGCQVEYHNGIEVRGDWIFNPCKNDRIQ